MTFYDFINENFWVVYFLLGVLIFIIIYSIVVVIYAFRDEREFSILSIIKVGPKNHFQKLKNNDQYKEIMDRTNNALGKFLDDDYLQKLEEIRSQLPVQTIDIVSIRSRIHHLLLEMAINIHGGFAGMSYPGRNLYAEFPAEQLADMLPELFDLKDKRNTIQEKIKDFYSLSETIIYGVQIPDDEFKITIQLGIFIINKLEKIKIMIHEKIKDEIDPRSYTEFELEKYNNKK